MCAVEVGSHGQTLETVVNRHLAAENAHRMEGTLAELHPDCTTTSVDHVLTTPGLSDADRVAIPGEAAAKLLNLKPA